MSKLFLFSDEPAGKTMNFFRLVIADDRDEAIQMILHPDADTLHDHLTQQMKPGGVYERYSSVRHALQRYLPYITVLPLEKGFLLRAGNGWTRTVPEGAESLQYRLQS